MKKFIILVALLMVATSAYAVNITADNGPQEIVACYAKGIGACTSGNVVVLQTSSPTYPGAEVTFTATNGLKIYGIVVDTTNYDQDDLDGGKWIRVMTRGYYSGVTIAGNNSITAGDSVGTSTTKGRATILADVAVSGNTIALESASSANEILNVVIGI